MSTLTKVFVVLVVLVSLVYLGVTATLFAYRIQYKTMWNAEVKAKADLKKEMDTKVADLNSALDTSRGETDAARQEANLAKNDADKYKGDVDDWKNKFNSLDASTKALEANFKELSAQYKQVYDQNQEMQKRVDDAQTRASAAEKDRDEAQQKYADASSELADVKKNLAELEKQYVDRMKDLQALQEQIKGLPPEVKLDTIGARPVDGVVQAVSAKMNLLIISVGKDEGVAVGNEMTVYRGDKFVGKVVVEKVDRDWSSAKSLEEFEQDHIQVGDKVSSRINQ